MTKLNVGKVQLNFQKPGYLEKTINFEVQKDTVLTVVLEKNPLALREVVITNDKKAL